jgi:methylglutaconyl-CoA hydratase
LAAQVKSVSTNDTAVVVILESEGEQAFCAGASFDELLAVKDEYAGTDFFMGFANLINAMRECPKFIIARVHGKIIGGGVGIVAASDYVFALDTAHVRLSELGIGFGPFVVGPAVERKIGKSAFMELAVDHDWHTAEWAKENGLYNHIYPTPHDMDEAVIKFAHKLSLCNPEAMGKLKTIFWEGTEDWDVLLQSRAGLSGELVTSDFTKDFIHSFKQK